MDKYNIIHLVSNKEWGGGEQYVHNLCAYFREAGYPICVISKPIRNIVSRFANLSIPIYTLPLRGGIDIISAIRLSKTIDKFDRSIIHVHNFKDAFTAVFARKLLINKTKKNVKIVLTRHLVRKGKSSAIYQWLYNEIDRIIFVSELSRIEFLKGFNGVDKWNTTVVHNSIISDCHFNSIDLRSELSINDNQTICMYHGRLAKEKGLNVLVEAIAILGPKAPVVVLIGTGDNEYVEKLRNQINTKGVDDKFVFAGFREPILPYLSTADFGILPSIVQESSSLSCMEYMSQGKTIIATNNGGQAEYLKSNENAILVPPDNAYKLAEAISLLTENVELRINLGKRAEKDFYENMSYSKFIEQIRKVYE